VPFRPDSQWKIVIAGGSLGGLCAGLALDRAGYDVQVYERDPGPMNTRGAGIVVQAELINLLRDGGAAPLPMTSCEVRRYLSPTGGDGEVQSAPQTFTSWEAIYMALRTAFPTSRYHMGAALNEAANSAAGGITAGIDGHGRVAADLLVCADGAQSPSRRRLLPNVRSNYAGYVAWRGVLDEAVTPLALKRFFDGAFTFSEARSGGHMLVYFIPGEGADTAHGKRRLNWVWYVLVPEAELTTLLVDRDGNHHHSSLAQGAAPQAAIDVLIERARREVHPRLADLVAATPDPFLQAVVDVVVPKTVFGRVCLLGDAAFVVRPHTAGSAAKAARDATVLAASLKRARTQLDAGLGAFEESQLHYGKDLTAYGVALGRRFASAR
jgi:2-polyprenyl-6-methoxyphenol hydroxylase-like FAD-dependent oxidoreductase